METRSRAKIKAITFPPRVATVGGTQPEMEISVGLPSSATGQPGDGRNSSRSSSVEAGARGTCRPLPRSESADGAHGPAQGVTEAAYQETACLGDCRKVLDTTTDEGRFSTHGLRALRH